MRWSNPFFCDLRSLALFRMCLGLVTLAHVLVILPDLAAFYTDDGLVPRELARQRNTYRLSLHFLSGELWWQALLMALLAAGSIALTLGWHTRLACFLCFVLVISMQTRNDFINQGGDQLHRTLLMFGIFAPLHVRWSLDRIRRKTINWWPSVGKLAIAALLLQMVALYLFSGLNKSGVQWTGSYEAVYMALRGTYALPSAEWLLHYPVSLSYLTQMVWWFEILVGLLLLSPLWQNATRMIAIPCLIALHAAFGLFLNIGLFPFDCLAGVMLFLPPTFWSKIRSLMQRRSLPCGWLEPSPAPTQARSSAWLRVPLLILVGLLLVNMLYHNIYRRFPGYLSYPEWLRPVSGALRLQQQWNLFAPQAGGQLGWVELSGLTESGAVVNPRVLSHAAPATIRPVNMARYIGNNRWLKLHEKAMQHRYAYRYIGPYYCRYWLQHFPEEPLRSITINRLTAFVMSDPDNARINYRHLQTIDCRKVYQKAPAPEGE